MATADEITSAAFSARLALMTATRVLEKTDAALAIGTGDEVVLIARSAAAYAVIEATAVAMETVEGLPDLQDLA